MTTPFAGHLRKIAAYDVPEHPGSDAPDDALTRYAIQKAAALNQHVLGYGALAESEWAARGLSAPDLDALRSYRLERVREQVRRLDVAGVLVYDPVNLRYATDAGNMQVWCLHNPVRYAWVGADGAVVLWDFHGSEHLSAHLSLIDDVRHAQSWYFFGNGSRIGETARRWADELADVVRGGASRAPVRIAVDRIDPVGVEALARLGIEVVDGAEVMELARSVKSADEILAIRRSVAACEAAVEAMALQMRPGVSENDLWSVLHAENVRRGGEWIETRLLSSGPRTNPWFQECSARLIEAGDLVAFDTDLVGPYGYCTDFSRTWLAGDAAPTPEQRTLYELAREQVEHNIALLRPGLGLREFAEQARTVPDDCLVNRYSVLAHGVGLCDEYPSIPYLEDWDVAGYDGELEAGMTLSVESYVGRLGGHEGVKLEQQVLLTGSGVELISTYPFDATLSS